MATAQMDTVIRHLRRTVLRQDGAGWTDGQLLASFIDQKDEAAFEALVRRHGRMVFGVCRRVLGNHHDAEDAFQATFLVLARKASSVRPRERVANWLHGVASRTAMKAKTMTAKRRGREKQVTEMPEPEAAQHDQWLGLQPLLDQELNGLPENYRLAILFCDLEGKTIKEAAQQLGWPQGSLAGRLARGRKLLAKRLTNRGVVLSAGSLVAVVSQNVASAGVPTSLMSSTVKAATMIAAGQATVAGVVPAKVAALTEGVLKAMLFAKLSITTALVVVGMLAIGAGTLPSWAAAQPDIQAREKEKARRKETAKTDLDRLQGVWSVVSVEQNGKPAKLEKTVFMVDGKRACLRTGDGELQGGLYLDQARTPKTYDFVMSERTIEGIYSLDGDTLRLCYNPATGAKRPVGFVTEKDKGQFLFVLKRVERAKAFGFLPDGTKVPFGQEGEAPPVEKKGKAPPLPPAPKYEAVKDETARPTASNPEDAQVENSDSLWYIKSKRERDGYKAVFIKSLAAMAQHFEDISHANLFEGRIEAGSCSPLTREGFLNILPCDDDGFLIVVRINKVVKAGTKSVRDAELERTILLTAAQPMHRGLYWILQT
jgi:RNA polymerase sigma factor (sigma-70 family)